MDKGRKNNPFTDRNSRFVRNEVEAKSVFVSPPRGGRCFERRQSDIYVPTSRSIAVLRAVRAYRRDGQRTETRLFQSGEAVDKDRNSVLGRWQRLRTDSKSPLRCGLDIYD